jgi:hypothetical protein
LCTNLCIHLLNPSRGHVCEVSWRLTYCPWTPKSCCRFVLVEKSKQMQCKFIVWAHWVTIFILTYFHHVIKDVFEASKNHSQSLFLHVSCVGRDLQSRQQSRFSSILLLLFQINLKHQRCPTKWYFHPSFSLWTP